MIKPSDIDPRLGQDDLNHMALTDMFGKSEAEFVAAAIIRTLARSGDEWGLSLTMDQLWPVIAEAGVVRAGIIDPAFGRQVLQAGDYITVDETDADAPTLTVTDKFVAKLRDKFAS